MFVTFQPGRIVKTESISLAKGKSEAIGVEGLYSRLKVSSDVKLFSADSTALSDGYTLAAGETLDVSGNCIIKNSSDTTVTLELIVFDTI